MRLGLGLTAEARSRSSLPSRRLNLAPEVLAAAALSDLLDRREDELQAARPRRKLL